MINRTDDSDTIQGRPTSCKYDVVLQAKLTMKIVMTHEFSPNGTPHSDMPL